MSYINHVISTMDEKLTSGYRPSNRPDHYGADFISKDKLQNTPRGVDIVAIADGIVGDSSIGGVYKGGEIGCTVAIQHDGKILSRYQHLRDGSIVVKNGERVKKGQKIGVMGNTGYCISYDTTVPPEYRGTHLHLGIKKNSTAYNNGDYVDPIPYLTGAKTIGAGTAAPPAVPDIPNVGNYMGDILFTNIKAYINGKQIALSTSDSKQNLPLIVVEDLAEYGFDVVYNNADRTLKVRRNKNKEAAGMYVEAMPDNVKSGDFKCKYVYTDIKTFLDGEQVSSYCIDGVTLIDAELLGRYGWVAWDGEERELWVALV